MFEYKTDDILSYQVKTFLKLNDIESTYESFLVIIDLLKEIPGLSSLNGDNKPYIHNDLNQKKAWQSYRKGLIKNYNIPNENLIVDDGFRSIFKICTALDITDNQFENLAKMHKKFMLAENIFGLALEEYIASHLKTFNWVWCSGNFVQGIDIIKKNSNNEWTFLQIKSRSNTENSSSNKIRNLIKNRTDIVIKDWYRLDVSDPSTQTLKWDELNTFTGATELSDAGLVSFFHEKYRKYSIFESILSKKINDLFEHKKIKLNLAKDSQRVLNNISQRKSQRIMPLSKSWQPTLNRYNLSISDIKNIQELQHALTSLINKYDNKIMQLDNEIVNLRNNHL